MAFTVYTVGHSTRPIEEFLTLLHAFGIELLVDIRTIAKSRRNPQYGQEALEASLQGGGIAYRRLEGLGGLRPARKDSVNQAWRNRSFRGYADHMQTAAFAESLSELIRLARERRTAIMCAEAVPWRCHRSLVGDALLVRGIAVEDIMTEKSSRPHALTPFAKVEGLTITYPSPTAGEETGRETARPARDARTDSV